MNLEEAIRARRSVREYTDEAVDDAALRLLIDAAILAPSAVNEQPWVFTVVRDRTVLAAISSAAKAYVLASRPVGVSSHHFRELLEDPHFDILYRAPVLIVISSASRGQWAVENCALAAENLMLAARAAGLGSCWIGFAQAWLGTSEGKATISLPKECVPVAPIIVGHPRTFPEAVPRKVADVRWIGAPH